MIKLETISFKGPNSLLLLFPFSCVCNCACEHALIMHISYMMIYHTFIFKKKLKNFIKKKNEGGGVGLFGDFHFFI